MKLKHNVCWIRDKSNPVLPPLEGSKYDNRLCMNPWVVREGDEYWLFYAGGGPDKHHRICLATAHVDAPQEWKRRGQLFDVGERGSFDGQWCVLPHAVKLDDGGWRI